MVSSQFSVLNGNSSPKSFLNQLVLSNGPPDLLPSSNCEDFEFSDVFGSSPVEASITVSSEKYGDHVATRGSGGKIYNDFDCNNIRSQSLLAPTTCIDRSLQLSKLTLHETEDALDLVEVLIDTQKGLKKHSINNTAVEKNDLHFDDYCLNNQTIGVEDFELLKVVGQGAFGKVYQVRRAGTSEIYAMKVMRKDKIMERNHAEYVKSEHTPISLHNRNAYGVAATALNISQHLWLQQPRHLSSSNLTPHRFVSPKHCSRTLMGLDMELEPAEVTES